LGRNTLTTRRIIMSKKLSIPTADFRVLLIQMIIRLIYRLGRTLLPNSKRHDLLIELQEAAFKLERHLKRNIKIKRTSIVKRSLWDAFYSKHLPEWLEVDYVDCLREEQCKDLKMSLKESKKMKKPKVLKKSKKKKEEEVGHPRPEASITRVLRKVDIEDVKPGYRYMHFSEHSIGQSYIGNTIFVGQKTYAILWANGYYDADFVNPITNFLFRNHLYEHPDEDYTKEPCTEIIRKQGEDYELSKVF
jgi:hypothetical protein